MCNDRPQVPDEEVEAAKEKFLAVQTAYELLVMSS